MSKKETGTAKQVNAGDTEVMGLVAAPPVKEIRYRDPSPEEVKEQIKKRFWKAINYLSVIFIYTIVYMGLIIADYAVFSLAWYLMAEEIQKYQQVAAAAEIAKIGIAFISIVALFIHSASSVWGQIKLDIEVARGNT